MFLHTESVEANLEYLKGNNSLRDKSKERFGVVAYKIAITDDNEIIVVNDMVNE